MRLVGDLASAGHVDIYHNGHWGSVCDGGWDLDEAQVVCRQMGFSEAIEFMSERSCSCVWLFWRSLISSAGQRATVQREWAGCEGSRVTFLALFLTLGGWSEGHR